MYWVGAWIQRWRRYGLITLWNLLISKDCKPWKQRNDTDINFYTEVCKINSLKFMQLLRKIIKVKYLTAFTASIHDPLLWPWEDWYGDKSMDSNLHQVLERAWQSWQSITRSLVGSFAHSHRIIFELPFLSSNLVFPHFLSHHSRCCQLLQITPQPPPFPVCAGFTLLQLSGDERWQLGDKCSSSLAPRMG